MASVAPYLNFNGNAEEAFNFYKTVFGGEFKMVMRFKDVPPEHRGSESEAEKIMHITLPLANGTLIMGSDVPEAFGKVTTGSNFTFLLIPKAKKKRINYSMACRQQGRYKCPWEKLFGALTLEC